MNCNTCGAAVQAAAGFCQHCGAPLGGGALAEAAPSIRFTFQAGALELFIRSVLMTLSCVFLIPAPWALSWYWKWLAEEIRASDGASLQFWGAAANVWKIVLLYILLVAASIGLGLLEREDEVNLWLLLGNILIQALSLAVGWLFTKWFLDHVELRGRRWCFEGSIWGFIGWNLLLYVSILTIIGWAWIMAGLYNWILSQVQNAGGTLQFAGAGYQVLWRTLAMVLFSLPIVTIPWAIRWYYAWLISQVELTPTAEA